MTEHTLHDNMRWKYMKRYFALAVIMCLLCLGVCLAGCSAKTESTDHTVTFDWKYNGIIDKVPADNGEKVTPPANVYRPNYDFDGWYFEDEYGDGIPWDFENHIVSGDMTLTARWSPAAFFVYFDPNGGVGNTEDSTAYWGEYFTFPTVVREGYYFAIEDSRGVPLARISFLGLNLAQLCKCPVMDRSTRFGVPSSVAARSTASSSAVASSSARESERQKSSSHNMFFR